MSRWPEKAVRCAEFFFLAGIFLLIVRKNTYPWPLKRASDILFLLAGLGVLLVIAYRREIRSFWVSFQKPLLGVGLMVLGLIAATLWNSPAGSWLGSQTLLNFSRFLEAGWILTIAFALEHYRPGFYKKAAAAQLSTLLYLPMLASNQADPGTLMPRFQLWENWPSNVGYYLLVSLTLLFLLVLENMRSGSQPGRNYFSRTAPGGFWWWALLAAGLAGIFLWTQSRAAWLAFLAVLFLMVAVWAWQRGRPGLGRSLGWFAAGGLAALAIFAAGFLLLPGTIKKIVFLRVFPAYQWMDYNEIRWANFGSLIQEGRVGFGLLRGPDRWELWRIYAARLKQSPAGLGLNYELVNETQGPHSTPLELLVNGGFLALLGFGYLVWLAGRNLAGRSPPGPERIWKLYLALALLGLLLASLFDNMSTFRLLWIILGLALAVKFRPNPESSEQRTGF